MESAITRHDYEAPILTDMQRISITTHANLQTKMFWITDWVMSFVADNKILKYVFKSE
jgi:hypothetical protein